MPAVHDVQRAVDDAGVPSADTALPLWDDGSRSVRVAWCVERCRSAHGWTHFRPAWSRASDPGRDPLDACGLWIPAFLRPDVGRADCRHRAGRYRGAIRTRRESVADLWPGAGSAKPD